MSRKNNRTKILVILVLLFVGVGLASQTLLGGVVGDEGVNINTIADVTLTDNKFIHTVLSPYAELDSATDSLRVIVEFDDVHLDVVAFKAVLVQSSTDTAIEVENMVWDGWSNWWSAIFSLDNIPQSSTYDVYRISFTANLPDYKYLQDGPVDYGLEGYSISVRIVNPMIAVADPISIKTTVPDFTVGAGDNKVLRWSFLYLNSVTITLTDNGTLLDTKSFSGNVLEQLYSYTFSSSYNGKHNLVLTITPDDQTDNPAASDSVVAFVTGGEDPPVGIPIWVYGFIIGIVVIIVILRVRGKK